MSGIDVETPPVRNLIESCLTQRQMYAAEAECVARRLVHSMHCVGTAGLATRLRQLLDWIDQGAVDPRAEVFVRHESPQLVVLDAGQGVSALASERAVGMILDRLPYAEVVTAIVTRCRPLEGAASYVVQLALEGVVAQCRVAAGETVLAGDAVAWGLPHCEGAWLVQAGESGPALDWALTHVLAGHGWRFRQPSRVTGGYFLHVVNRTRHVADGELREAFEALRGFSHQHGIAPNGGVVPEMRTGARLTFLPDELTALHSLCVDLDIPCEMPRP